MVREKREFREAAYTPPSDLELPPEVVEIFREKGMHLRWIRATVDTEDDARNIARRLREGYQFVSKQEIPENYREFFDTKKIRNNNSVICVGDLVLGKIPLERAEARQRYYEDASTQQVKAAANEAKKSDDSRMKAMAPVSNTSRSEISVGKNADKDPNGSSEED